MALLLCAFIALVLGTASSQVAALPIPDFSGRWMIVGAPTGRPVALLGVGGLGSAFEVRQDARTLTLVTGNDPDHRETALPLNGEEMRTPSAGPQEEIWRAAKVAPPDYVAKLAWDGARLIITTTLERVDLRAMRGPAPGVSMIQNWSLDANGNLQIEGTAVPPNLNPGISKATYRKFR